MISNSKYLNYALSVLSISLSMILVGVHSGYSQESRSKPANCVLIVKTKHIINGECLFSLIGNNGSFQITGYNGQYFGQVLISESNVAEGYWNEDAYTNHAHSKLGTLKREEACWVNNIASVCAY